MLTWVYSARVIFAPLHLLLKRVQNDGSGVHFPTVFARNAIGFHLLVNGLERLFKALRFLDVQFLHSCHSVACALRSASAAS